MKKILYMTFASSLLLTASCVDLNQEPLSFITEEEYIEYPKDVASTAKGVTALYHDLWGGNYGFNTRLQRLSVSADDITYSPTKANNPLGLFESLTPSISGNDADFSNPWIFFYKVISSANKIIEGTPIPTTKPEEMQQVLGEAYFMRGLSYFYLVRLFGEVPLMLTKADIKEGVPRTSVAEIYDKAIIPSLTKAAEWLPSKSRSGFSSTPSQWAAKACLADAYITMAGWPLNKGQEYYGKAAVTAKDIILNSGLKLTEKYANLWMEDKKEEANEHLFALHHNAKQKTASNYGKSYYPADFFPNAGWSDYYANESFYLKYPDDDRKAHNFMVKWPVSKSKVVNYKESADGLPAISKYYNYNEGAPGKSAQANGITCIYRYADVLLMYAEASVRATNTIDPLARKSLEEVQSRAHSSLTKTTDPQSFINAVFDERGWEFFAEMKRWFDLVRLQKLSEVKPTEWEGSLFKANSHYYFPVPSQQILLTEWTNNAGY
ncbi:RagB/SusD family nutrient uptake outer membrane protein [Bacteroides helcogenes]|uniref:RagB/SusD domain protein n=1 Tax=Bacteroides helcogenes (strain ATCC 35417 / DSM 20613 / JCM 6297 / CCUG 15421 / P 36-108) TaxID=693979 RepID=E6SWK4_BACT6|nr:RagB/SusD family nutrient uptake outer membrane protein [Bacteroides helcogenes]ADV42602.1 RagB/SusD domain protein [Bacteroides helcogenes P 36-108]MDY5237636.1 RagB/SusD family nutrient uptake outer membrane protein [Bacteroides helcogenes]